jgi:hypothetical protein
MLFLKIKFGLFIIKLFFPTFSTAPVPPKDEEAAAVAYNLVEASE